MRILYHHWLSPFARSVRLALGEKGLAADERLHLDWRRDEAFLSLNPAGTVPVLIESETCILSDSRAIWEYLDEVYPEVPLLPADPAARAEARRVAAWFDVKFHDEVSAPLVKEKLLKRVLGTGAPDSRVIRAAQGNLHAHLDYVSWLAERRSWLAGDRLTMADFVAAAHVSLIDYAGDVAWERHGFAKEWYARIKSRPCFRSLLRETIPGVPASGHYGDLDF